MILLRAESPIANPEPFITAHFGRFVPVRTHRTEVRLAYGLRESFQTALS